MVDVSSGSDNNDNVVETSGSDDSVECDEPHKDAPEKPSTRAQEVTSVESPKAFSPGLAGEGSMSGSDNSAASEPIEESTSKPVSETACKETSEAVSESVSKPVSETVSKSAPESAPESAKSKPDEAVVPETVEPETDGLDDSIPVPAKDVAPKSNEPESTGPGSSEPLEPVEVVVAADSVVGTELTDKVTGQASPPKSGDVTDTAQNYGDASGASLTSGECGNSAIDESAVCSSDGESFHDASDEQVQIDHRLDRPLEESEEICFKTEPSDLDCTPLTTPGDMTCQKIKPPYSLKRSLSVPSSFGSRKRAKSGNGPFLAKNKIALRRRANAFSRDYSRLPAKELVLVMKEKLARLRH